MEWLQSILKHSPEILLFLSISIGFWIGKFQVGKFQLGGVAGSLLVAVVLSLIGVSVDNGVKSILFALFIYAVGFESGPQFFKSLGKFNQGNSPCCIYGDLWSDHCLGHGKNLPSG